MLAVALRRSRHRRCWLQRGCPGERRNISPQHAQHPSPVDLAARCQQSLTSIVPTATRAGGRSGGLPFADLHLAAAKLDGRLRLRAVSERFLRLNLRHLPGSRRFGKGRHVRDFLPAFARLAHSEKPLLLCRYIERRSGEKALQPLDVSPAFGDFAAVGA